MLEFLLSLFAVILVAGLAITVALLPLLVVIMIWQEVDRIQEVNRIKGKK